MVWTKLIGIVMSGALVGVVAFAGNGCSSSKSSGITYQDGSTTDGSKHDSGSSSGGSGSGSGAGDDSGGDSGGSFDGTTGKACMTDADCHTATGPGINKCTNDVVFSGSSGNAALYPTPICFMPAACDPGIDGNIHFCDGPDDPSSPGVCYPTTNPPQTGKGTCFPQCAFKPDGSASTGCQGKDTCSAYGFTQDASGNPVGIGLCYGGCASDADCANSATNATTPADKTQKCDTTYGICATTVTAPTAPFAGGCNSTSTTATCFCLANTSSNLGYCTRACLTSTHGAECPSGWVCDASLPTSLIDSNDATIAGWTGVNSGMSGFCAPACNVDSGVAVDTDSGTCLSNSTCQAGDVGGPDCLP